MLKLITAIALVLSITSANAATAAALAPLPIVWQFVHFAFPLKMANPFLSSCVRSAMPFR